MHEFNTPENVTFLIARARQIINYKLRNFKNRPKVKYKKKSSDYVHNFYISYT